MKQSLDNFEKDHWARQRRKLGEPTLKEQIIIERFRDPKKYWKSKKSELYQEEFNQELRMAMGHLDSPYSSRYDGDLVILREAIIRTRYN